MPPLSTWGWLVDAALVEDLGPGDVTSRLLVDAAERGEARVEAREPLVLAGTEVARTVFARTGASLESRAADGERVEAGTVLAVVAGPVRAVLEGERVALNFLQRLSGVATLTRAYSARARRRRAGGRSRSSRSDAGAARITARVCSTGS
jgi:nicotinate-nucleotide pyrophosphorylase (carboxylating)